MLETIWFWLWVIIGNILGLIVIIPYYFIGKPSELRYLIRKLISELTAFTMTKAKFWKVVFIDNRYIKKKGPYVIVSNHVSIIDTLFTSMLPFDIVYTWKKKWSYVPGFGWLCLLADHIPIDNTDLSKKEAIKRSEVAIDNGSSVLFYAEGTRNVTGKGLLPFKTGAFRVAMSKDVEIIPITLIGTYDVFNSGIIKVIIDEPIRIDNIEEGIAEVRSVIEKNLSYFSSQNINKITTYGKLD